MIFLLFSVPGGPPTTFALRADSPYNVTISWSTPTTPNGIITGYNLYITFGNGTTTVERSSPSDREFVLTYLSPYETVTTHMSARTVIGEGPRTVSRQAVTHETRKLFSIAGWDVIVELCFTTPPTSQHPLLSIQTTPPSTPFRTTGSTSHGKLQTTSTYNFTTTRWWYTMSRRDITSPLLYLLLTQKKWTFLIYVSLTLFIKFKYPSFCYFHSTLHGLHCDCSRSYHCWPE